jgi:hypothetical protein
LLTNLLANLNLLDNLSVERIDMRIYMQDNRHWFKWVLGLVIFLVALSVTFDNVYGTDTYEYATGYTDEGTPETSPPSAVPEPATLILLASGLVALRLMHQKKR